jgi:hypothetical protein
MRFYLGDLQANVMTWYEYKNALVIDMAYPEEKIAILVQKSNDKTQEGKPGALFSVR